MQADAASSVNQPSMDTVGKMAKPFAPEEANNIVMSLDRPAVFSNMVCDWPAQHWNANYLSEKLKGKKIRFRMGKIKPDTDIQFETQCNYVDATVEHFLAWSSRKPIFPSPFAPFDSCDYWAYADYKYMAMLLSNNTDMFQDVVWADFGFPDRNGRESTLWIGTQGANTPCHVDTYGCNLVVQVQGRKKWYMFPPEDTPFMYPTRIPYEESSIFSKVNVANPDWKSCPQFRNAQAHVVTLQPGEVLFVPRHWWHYVESIDPITVSVNTWIELDEDHEARVEEAITRMLVCAIKSSHDPGNIEVWLNPTEAEVTSHATNLQFLNQAVSACLENRGRANSKDKLHRPCNEPIPMLSIKKRKLSGGDCMDGGASLHAVHNRSNLDPGQLLKMSPGLNLVPALPRLDSDNTYVCQLTKTALEPSHDTDKPSAPNADERVLVDHTDFEGNPSYSAKTITTNEVLDCLVNPQVVHLMARLLLERQGS